MDPRSTASYPPIPVVATGPAFPIETLEQAGDRLEALFKAATRHTPAAALKVGDAISRRWLVKSQNRYLPEIDEIARRVQRPGAYFFAVNYEWGCTCGVGRCPDGRAARLIRVLDWRTPGLGRNLIAARVTSGAGSFVALTWPGYTGVLQAMAPGRFAAALNQAPMRKLGGGFLPLDWAANRLRVWRLRNTTAAHLLREVFEECVTFAAAKQRLISTPIAAPAIFSLTGLDATEACVIERTEDEVRLHEGIGTAANHWQSPGWTGHARGEDSDGRARQMALIRADYDPSFPWLTPPILNARTRLAMVAGAAENRLVARGYEADGPATAPLEIRA